MNQNQPNSADSPDRPCVKQILERCAEELNGCGQPQVVAAFVYGSILSSRYRLDSDLDVALLDREDAPLSWKDQSEIMDTLEKACGCPVDLRMLREGSPSYQWHVLTMGRLVYCQDARALERCREIVRDALDRAHVTDANTWRQTLRAFAARRAR